MNHTPKQALGELGKFVFTAMGATAALHFLIPLLNLRFSFSLTSPALYLYLLGLATPAIAATLSVRKGARRAFWRSILAPKGSAATYAIAVFAQAGILAGAWIIVLAGDAQAKPTVSLAPDFLLLSVGQIWVVLGEEPGWRGFALPRLQVLMSPRLATLALALLWGVWHTPMFFVQDSLQATASPWLFASSIFAWSAIHTVLYERSSPSIVPSLLLHACSNIWLNTGLTTGVLQPYLITSYTLVGLVAWFAIGRSRTAVTPSAALTQAADGS